MSFFSQLIDDCIEQFDSNPFGFPDNIISVAKLFYWHGFLKHFRSSFIGKHDGMDILYDTSSDGCAFTYYRPYLEFPLYWFVKNYVRKNDMVIDIGANIGNYTMLSAKNGANVFAFEPNSETSRLCRVNVLLNRFKNVTVSDVAVSNKKGTALFHLQSIGKSGVSSLVNPTDGARSVQVETDTLDLFTKKAGIEKINFLKIDVEGAEGMVLTGAKKLLQQRQIEVMVWETNEQYKNRQTEKLLKMISNFGYETVYLDEKKRRVRPWQNDSIAFSYLPTPRIRKILQKWETSR